ncbi:cellulose biosynthesis protein BcsC [Siccirubricoccus sp. G192]|uniref:cellulose biosynthesis protein BcsC n=1 Tax=Siccirubricoccus sp. G192 TaxID=2849651 RepID=UPI001C2CAA5F|nr:cellulose biosynthesis protein BcsC [Siccirubricoccus sp. G192]MBV1796702.1 BCSC C-terminal domain-containing protein [Siccirubricoccus sp. G192]
MSQPRVFPILVLAASLGAWALPASAQENGAVAALLRQGGHWRQQNRADLALRTYERVLAAEPANAEALAGAAQAEAQLGNRSAAEALLARLRQAAPGDPRLAEVEAGIRGAGLDSAGLAEARRLAQAGRTAEAVARYRELFGASRPPLALAPEFYTLLAGTEGGHAEARDALAAMAAGARGNARLQLAHAQVLTYREASRAEGMALLGRLAADPAVGAAATAAWRQALLWLGTGPAAVPELEAYLRQVPNDSAMARRLAEAQAPPAGAAPADLARQAGFERLNANRLREAAAGFEAALAANPRDADALGGLGVVRLREGRMAEARDLLEAAIAAAPEHRAQWQRALDGAAYATELADGRARLRAGETEAAEAALTRAAGREVPDRADAEALLGDILLRRGDAAAAEARYRAALARRPDFGAALTGLQRALRLQGRGPEAEALARRIEAPARNQPPSRSTALREQAARAADPDAALALLRAAVAADPADPWARLDLARALRRQGRMAEARALVEERLGSPDSLHAAAIFADEDGRPAEAVALLERIPARLRTADMGRLAARARTAGEVEAAAALARAGGIEGRARLLAIALRPDPSGAGPAAVIRAFGAAGDGRSAEEAARATLAANRNPSPAARIAIAGALLEAGQDGPAQSVLATLQGEARLSAEEQRQLLALQSGVAVRGSDRLNERGERAAAYDRLRPVLARDPSDAAANLALARLHQGARQPEEAGRIATAVLARDPRNLDARAGAVDAALAARELRRAEALVAEARALAPNEPRVSLMEARVARAAGDQRRALRALETAAAQRSAQLGEDRAAGQVFLAGGPGFAPSSVDNPFRRTGPVEAGEGSQAPRDALAGEIARELAAVQDETAPRFTLSPAVRSRSGSGGLDRLNDLSAQAEASFAPGGLGGRLAFRATPVSISAGNLETDTATLRRFGSNPLAGPGGGTAPRDVAATGLGLGLGYQRDGFSADIGTTPLGFRQQNLVGGVEVAPLLGDTLRLRVQGERRAVTDSVLSWAGLRDPGTGRVWGGVTRTGGRAQLEFGTGPVTFYAGGGYAQIEGQGVVDNARLEAGAGASYLVFRRPDSDLTAGLDLVYFAYDKNLRHFTLGHGGYFSPQSYAALNLPVDYRARSGDLAWHLGATLGFASWREDAAPVFPGDAGLQGQLRAAAASDATLATTYPGRSQSGFIGGLRGDIEYPLTPQLRLGGLLRYDRAANWNEARGLLYLRYRTE